MLVHEGSSKENSGVASPQCQFFVVRKKRLCRMTVRPGRHYCGEHEPQPVLESGENDTRIPCPNDPKHTCYASKLQKHLSICNARAGERPPYIEPGVNAPAPAPAPRRPLALVPPHKLLQLIDKVNKIYDEHVKDNITECPEESIHPAVAPEYQEAGRAESSRRHLRQASALLRLAERERLVAPHSCYLELGAGKGHLSYYAWRAWCWAGEAARGSGVLLVDRASLRHKRDNKLRDLAATRAPAADTGATAADTGATAADTGATSPADDAAASQRQDASLEIERNIIIEHSAQDSTSSPQEWAGAQRLRADLADLVLQRVPAVQAATHVVGFAKHLCGVATDYALRCVTARGVVGKTRGLVLATCCHHRCHAPAYFGAEQLKALGIDEEDLEIMFGVVSWGTCGDGRSRARRRDDAGAGAGAARDPAPGEESDPLARLARLREDSAARAAAGRRAAAVLDWGRALRLRALGLRARLTRFVPAAASPENTAIVASAR